MQNYRCCLIIQLFNYLLYVFFSVFARENFFHCFLKSLPLANDDINNIYSYSNMQQIMASIITFLYKKDCRDKKTF